MHKARIKNRSSSTHRRVFTGDHLADVWVGRALNNFGGLHQSWEDLVGSRLIIQGRAFILRWMCLHWSAIPEDGVDGVWNIDSKAWDDVFFHGISDLFPMLRCVCETACVQRPRDLLKRGIGLMGKKGRELMVAVLALSAQWTPAPYVYIAGLRNNIALQNCSEKWRAQWEVMLPWRGRLPSASYRLKS